MEIAVAKG